MMTAFPGIRTCLTVASSVLLMTAPHLAQAAIVVHTDDFIAPASVTARNGFEGAPNDGTYYTGGSGPYTEQGISVQQINSSATIWMTFFHPQGNLGWYPDGGDNGYTQITDGGLNFSSVEFQVGTGFASADKVLFELLEGGSVVLSGSIPGAGNGVAHFLGFSGGGFDTILLRDEHGDPTATVTDGGINGLAIDAIEIAATAQIPEPSTVCLLGIAGLIGTVLRRRNGNALLSRRAP